MISKKNILDFEARRKIFKFVEDNPGLNVNEISRRIEVPLTTLLHHLRILEKQDLIDLKSKGKYTLIYSKYELGVQEKEILELLRKKIPCRILLYSYFSTSCSQIELSRELNLHPSTINYHLKKMIKMGIIEEAPVKNGYIYPNATPNDTRIQCRTSKGREIFYRRKNPKTSKAIGRIMTVHKNSLSNKRYIDEYFSYLKSLRDCGFVKNDYKKNTERIVIEKDGKKVTHFKILTNEEMCDLILEFFKLPFCA
ncbi:MAG: winged helix-turn-helix transcriptional regulator [Thermoplasmatales archaeon]|nr:MAG: winged helix-turn-helix transcriptional regulator [Thermoplasmatales archaeon]